MAAVVGGGAGTIAVRRELPALQATLHSATVLARQDARVASRNRLSIELGTSIPSVAGAIMADDVGAMAAAGSLASAWGQSALSTISSTDEANVARELTALPGVIDYRVRRTAVTEVAYAFNDERYEALIEFAERFREPPQGPGDRGQPAPGMFKVWSAILDGKTCPRCFSHDGQLVGMHESFSEGPPPLHSHCRCIEEAVIIGKTERLEDIQIDYELFKQELRDVIREGRAESQRHALGFVADSIGPTRSPVALSKRFHNESYLTKR